MEKRPRVSRWLVRLFGYDGLLPALVILIPTSLHLLFRNARWVELLALILPIAAYIFRAGIGLEMIESNQSGRWLRRTQNSIVLCTISVAHRRRDSDTNRYIAEGWVHVIRLSRVSTDLHALLVFHGDRNVPRSHRANWIIAEQCNARPARWQRHFANKSLLATT